MQCSFKSDRSDLRENKVEKMAGFIMAYMWQRAVVTEGLFGIPALPLTSRANSLNRANNRALHLLRFGGRLSILEQ